MVEIGNYWLVIPVFLCYPCSILISLIAAFAEADAGPPTTTLASPYFLKRRPAPTDFLNAHLLPMLQSNFYWNRGCFCSNAMPLLRSCVEKSLQLKSIRLKSFRSTSDFPTEWEFQRRRCGPKNNSNAAITGAHDREVPCRVSQTFLLLERMIVFFVDDNQAEVGDWCKHGRACAND